MILHNVEAHINHISIRISRQVAAPLPAVCVPPAAHFAPFRNGRAKISHAYWQQACMRLAAGGSASGAAACCGPGASTLEQLQSSTLSLPDEAFARLADAHCHPQDDVANAEAVGKLCCAYVAAMGVREGDWPLVQRLQALAPAKVIPCFGVHPWFSHLHAVQPVSDIREILEAKSEAEFEKLSPELLATVPSVTWEAKLRELLEAYPKAVVGEFGIDRAAVIPGTKVSTRLSHQLALTERQLAIAAAAGRPVSLHCVRGYGHLADIFRRLPAGGHPPAVMLHSFGGDVQVISQFTKMPAIGRRFYFSFSTVINGRAPEKMLARIAAVPDDRLLLESDQNTPLAVDDALCAALQAVAAAKGWGVEEALERTFSNYREFFAGTLPS